MGLYKKAIALFVALTQSGKYQKELATYDEVLKLDPKDAGTWYNKGIALGVLKRREESLSSFEEALRINPKDKDAWFHKGLTLGVLGRPNEAISAYDEALKIDPTYTEAWYLKYITLMVLDRSAKEALSSIKEARKLDPNEEVLKKTMAMKAFKCPRCGVENAYNETRKCNCGYEPHSIAIVHFNRGVNSQDKKEWDKAIDNFSKAIEFWPGYYLAHVGRGIAYGEKNEHDLAIKDFDEAIERYPTSVEAYLNRGIAYIRNHEYDRALKDFDKVIEINPENVDIMVYAKRSVCYHEKGDNLNEEKELKAVLNKLKKLLQSEKFLMEMRERFAHFPPSLRDYSLDEKIKEVEREIFSVFSLEDLKELREKLKQ